MGGGRITSEITQVMLPSGEVIWVRLQESEPVVAGERATGAEDAGLGDRITAAAEVVRLPGFAETVRGVVASVRQAVDEHRPDSLTVEFGIEITVGTGAVLSVLAQGGGKAQVKVTATWDRSDVPAPGRAKGAEEEAVQ
jgi:hypothetical protein